VLEHVGQHVRHAQAERLKSGQELLVGQHPSKLIQDSRAGAKLQGVRLGKTQDLLGQARPKKPGDPGIGIEYDAQRLLRRRGPAQRVDEVVELIGRHGLGRRRGGYDISNRRGREALEVQGVSIGPEDEAVGGVKTLSDVWRELQSPLRGQFDDLHHEEDPSLRVRAVAVIGLRKYTGRPIARPREARRAQRGTERGGRPSRQAGQTEVSVRRLG